MSTHVCDELLCTFTHDVLNWSSDQSKVVENLLRRDDGTLVWVSSRANRDYVNRLIDHNHFTIMNKISAFVSSLFI
jgi:hypothetical protein